MSDPVVAVVGATGAVGVEILKCLDRRGFPVGGLRLLASPRSAGKTVDFRGRTLTVEALTRESFRGVDVALFSAGGSISREFAPAAVEAGAVVVDNSSAFRMDPDVPLVVPEINPQAIGAHRGIVANPNCSTIIALMALWPVHRRYRVRRLIAATYQAASGAGQAAMDELVAGTRAFLDGVPFEPRVIPYPYAFNVFSHNSKVDPETGYNEEETKLLKESRKILGEPDLRVSATCVRVPVLRAHAEALTVECERPVTPEAVRELLSSAPGVRIVDDRAANRFPMPIDASGEDDVLVGRIRADTSDPSGHSFAMFVCGDQLLKGAALNAVQIAERLVAR
jgi:aspartate-semialdehyde dehydrogenase